MEEGMISWIQNVLERKGRIVFIILLAVVVVAFVFVIGETPGCVSKAPGTQARDYYGYNLDSEAQMRPLVQEVLISSIVNRGRRPQDAQMLEQEMLSRAALLHMADQVGIPAPSQSAFVTFLAEIPFFQDAEGNFDPDRVTSFLDMSQLSRQFDEATINRALANDFRIRQLMQSVAPPGFTIPFDVEEQARRLSAVYDLSVGTLSEDAVEFEFDPEEEDLETFFSQRVEAYRIPESRMLVLVSFLPENFSARVEDPSESELSGFFDRNRADFVEEDAGNPADALPKLDKVRDAVVAQWKAEQAETLARKAAEEFVYAVFDQEIGMDDPQRAQLAAGFGGVLKELPPMKGQTPPEGVDLPAQSVAEAARLDSIRHFSDPFEREDGVGVLLLEEIIPSRIPALSEVRETVLADLRQEDKRAAFVEKGEQVRADLATALAEGKTFADAAVEQGLSTESFENVGWDEQPEGFDNGLLRRAETLPDGTVSPMVVTGGKGTFLFVSARGAPAFAPDSETYIETRRMIASDNSRRFLSSFVGDLIQAGLAQAQSDVVR